MAEENEQGTHLDVPDFLQYSHDHVWVDESVTPAVLGITEFAANKMGDIVFVDLPEVGMRVEAGDELVQIESAKAVEPIELDDDERDLLSAGEYAKFIAQQQ